MGKAATELKLLACQRNDRTWSAVPGEEIVPGEEVASYENGALVMVEVNGKRIQGAPKPGGPSLVSLLENFSKLMVGQKEKDEEIEAWNQSLTIQAQELNQREMEFEAELTQLEQLREEVQGVEEKLQAAEEAKAEADRAREELARKTQELEQAWEHLRGEQRRLDERESEAQPQTGAALDSDRAAQLLELVSYLETTTGGTDNLQAELEATFALLSEQQASVDAQWQDLEAQRARATESQEALNRQSENLNDRRQQLQEATVAIEDARSALQGQQQALAVEEESLKAWQDRQQASQDLYEMLARLSAGAGESASDAGVALDLAALENMPLGELQGKVEELQKDLSRVVQFVNEQEEELTAERQELDELQQKLDGASEYDRINLEQELADARDRYKMLDETLVGQRREVRERESILSQHLRILQRRQGIATDSGDGQQIDLRPILANLETERQQQQETVSSRQAGIEEMRASLQPLEKALAEKLEARDRQEQELKQLEADWLQQQVSTAELWAAVHSRQEILQSLQDRVSQIDNKLDTLSEASNSAREASDYQRQAIASLREIVSSLS